MYNALPRILRAILPGLVLLPAAAANAGISISPLQVDLDAQRQAAAVTVSNPGSETLLIQVEASAWSHAADGSDRYEPTRTIVVNPPLFRIPAGGTQVVRVGLARQQSPDPATEKSFRLFFEELPQDTATKQSQLQMLLRIGIPVFLKPVQPAAAALQWKVSRMDGGRLAIKVVNGGRLHEKVSAVELRRPESDAGLGKVEGFAYLLPGDRRQWIVPLDVTNLSGKITLNAKTEAGVLHAELPIEQP